jgi:hypothetical protein
MVILAKFGVPPEAKVMLWIILLILAEYAWMSADQAAGDTMVMSLTVQTTQSLLHILL